MKALLTKPKRQSLQPLQEREIQERLYGRYHKAVMPAAEKPDASLDSLSKQLLEPSKRDVLPSWPVSVFNWAKTEILRWAVGFPWKFAGIVIAALGLAIILFQVLSLLFAKIRVNSAADELSRAPEILSEVSQIKPKPGAATAPILAAAPLRERAETRPPTAIKRKVFAVQVCTYERADDARYLTRELQEIGFPAFYKQFVSSREHVPHFVVFLSQDSTFVEAQARLSEFRKTKQFLTFSDSYIRSL